MTLDEAIDIVLYHHDDERYVAAAMQLAGEAVRLQLELTNVHEVIAIPEMDRVNTAYKNAYKEAAAIMRSTIKGHSIARLPVGMDTLEELCKAFANIGGINHRTLKPLGSDKT